MDLNHLVPKETMIAVGAMLLGFAAWKATWFTVGLVKSVILLAGKIAFPPVIFGTCLLMGCALCGAGIGDASAGSEAGTITLGQLHLVPMLPIFRGLVIGVGAGSILSAVAYAIYKCP